MTTLSSRADEITDAAIASVDNCPDPRLKELLQGLIRHLHAFAKEVRLTQDEWTAAIDILKATGDLTDDKRSEFILWSDALGLSSLVDALGNPFPAGAMESTVLGPFWTPNAPHRAYAESMIQRPLGAPALVRGRVLDVRGGPIAGAELDVWQNDANGLYTVQEPESDQDHLRGRYRSREDGSYAFVGVRPIPYTIPHDGPVGAMLEAARRHPWRPAHIHMIVTAPGFQRLQTHIFDSTSDYLDSDAVFAVKRSLIRTFVPRGADDPERPPSIASGEWYSVDNDIVLAPVE
jgi:protocatechuate 3,4-dioxygenase beta subunit